SMGLRAGHCPGWPGGADPLGIEGLAERQLAEKARLLDTRRGQIFALRPPALAAAREAADFVSAALNHPALPATDSDGKAVFLACCQLIPEDVLLLLPAASKTEPEWYLQGGLLAFPGHWQLGEKMGKTLAELHSPVPEFAQRLARPVNRFFTRMQEATPSWRQNWSLQTDDRLYAPHREAIGLEKLSPALAGHSVFVRIETQHFYKLPASGAVMFFIRTSLAPLDFWQDNISPIAELAAQLRQLSPAMTAYKGLGGMLPALEGWLKIQMDI
ncbi:MAG: heme-dependent oxidative N-demethylase family protein, partial [Candidatus Puniceispirillaceae bacterium]